MSRPVGDRRLTRVGAGAALSLALLLVGAACSSPPAEPNFTVEEAGFLAKGELFDIYGVAADPVAVEISGERATIDGEPVWALHLLVDVTDDGVRQRVEWDIAVGAGPDGPVIVSAEQRR